MKCPWRFRGRYFDLQTTELIGGDCLQAECAWWDEVLKRCGVTTLGACLDGILSTVKELYDKMPHEDGAGRR
uniref:Uncharacterized protein n=1 Tax=viral metagenome TaxID=1070528 RepID=A0A6H2A3B4_9ZZZZ